jgi:hypothetical protein
VGEMRMKVVKEHSVCPRYWGLVRMSLEASEFTYRVLLNGIV